MRPELELLNFGLLGDRQRVIDVDSEVSHCAFQPMASRP
jgi:hypothetical protein